jgi:N-acyl homoserine lactone hydrolase
MARGTTIERVHFGFLVAPADGRDAGQPIPVCGYVVRHADALLLFDTGFAPVDEDTRRRYRPRSTPVEDALGRVNIRLRDIDVVVNCHLHADHAGGNASFPGVPIHVQQPEIDAANEPDYTVASHTHAFPGARIVVAVGESEPLPGVRIVPTVGHSPGHQALVVETGSDVVILAGQAFSTASEFGFAAFASRLAREGNGAIGESPEWMDRLLSLDPARVLFAHDLAVHERDVADIGAPRPL